MNIQHLSPDLVPLDDTFVVYEWNAWDDFLIARLAPDAVVISASVTQPLDSILRAVPESARTFLCHLDCTVTAKFPVCRKELFEVLDKRGVRILNRSVSDISKKTLQKTCSRVGLHSSAASPTGDPGETLIVKSNLNFGGKNENFLTPEDRALLGVDFQPTPIKGPYEYPVLPRRDIPSEWWLNEGLIIERYVNNQNNLYYRCWFFLDRILLIEMFNPHDVKKMGKSRLTRHWKALTGEDSIRWASSSDFPEQLVSDLLRFKAEFQLDFGTVDVVIDDANRPHIIDVNTTPYFNVNLPIPNLVEFLRLEHSVGAELA